MVTTPTIPSPVESHPSSKRTASDETEAQEEETKKKKKMKINTKKNTKLSSPLIIRIWNEEDELSILKGFVDYGAGVQTKTDWDAFYLFLGGSIVAKFSKEQGEDGVGMDKEMLKEDKEHLTLVQQQKTGLLDKHIRAKVARLC